MSYELKATYASLPRTKRGMPIVLGGDPKGKNVLYTNGNSVIIRSIDNPAEADVYTQHAVATTVAKYSPSGFYIASGDVSGKVRIWDTTQKEHILKNEFRPLGGAIKDICWTSDSQRIVAVGEGREKFGAVFMAETGASVGEVMGQSQSINSADFRPQRPFRLVTASEDSSLAFFEGPPFKFKKTMNDHTKFVNCVRYAPNGEIFISGGSEGKAYVYDGKTGDKQSELGSPAHKGGIYAMSFSPDSARLLTVSGDKTAKVWDLSSMTAVQEIVMGKAVEDMLVGCLWQGNQFLTVALSGFISFFDADNCSAPSRVIKGHNKPITAMSITEDRQSIITGSSDGLVCRWNGATGDNDVILGKGHSNQVQDMSLSGDTVVTCGIDDMVMYASLSSMQYSQGVKMPSQPRGIAAASGGLVVVACQKEVVVMKGGHIVSTLPISFEAQCAAIHPGLTQVAVGGADFKVRIYDLTSDALRESQELSQTGALTSIEYSPDGALMAAADGNRKVALYELPSYTAKINSEWGYHTAKVNHLTWTPDSQHLGSGGLDTQLVIWWPQSTTKYTVIKAAHPMSQVTRVGWLTDNLLVSSGQDSCLKLWAITHLQ